MIRIATWLLLLTAGAAGLQAEQSALNVLLLGPENTRPIATALRKLLELDGVTKGSKLDWQDTREGDPKTVNGGTSLMNFFYFPEKRAERHAFLKQQWSHVVLIEADRTLWYPEMFFEGVRAISGAVKGKTYLVMTKPARSRHTAGQWAGRFYRIGAGCGVTVVPAEFALEKATGPREFTVAACIYSQLTGRSAEKLVAEAARKKQAALASATVAAQAGQPHFKGPFRGTVRIARSDRKRFRMLSIGTSTEGLWREQMSAVLRNVGCQGDQSEVWAPGGFRKPALPAVEGRLKKASFDLIISRRYDVPVDALRKLPGAKGAMLQVFDRHWDQSKNLKLVVSSMESALLYTSYHAARQKLVHIPFHVAVARMSLARPQARFTTDGVHWTPWYAYMAASMSYTALTGRSAVMTRAFWDEQHPDDARQADYMHTAARIGHRVMLELSTLTKKP